MWRNEGIWETSSKQRMLLDCCSINFKLIFLFSSFTLSSDASTSWHLAHLRLPFNLSYFPVAQIFYSENQLLQNVTKNAMSSSQSWCKTSKASTFFQFKSIYSFSLVLRWCSRIRGSTKKKSSKLNQRATTSHVQHFVLLLHQWKDEQGKNKNLKTKNSISKGFEFNLISCDTFIQVYEANRVLLELNCVVNVSWASLFSVKRFLMFAP